MGHEYVEMKNPPAAIGRGVLNHFPGVEKYISRQIPAFEIAGKKEDPIASLQNPQGGPLTSKN